MPARPLCVLLACLAAGANPARAEELFFQVDPERSVITLAAGSQAVLPLPQNFSGIGFGSRTMAYLAPQGGTPGKLPDGSTSDGLRTALVGLLRTDFADPPATLRIVRDATQLQLGTSGSWTPGLPNQPATPAPAGLALRFTDPALGWQWSAALREWTLSVSTEGVGTALTPSGGDSWSFAAGCASPTPGCPAFRVENGNIDSADSNGFLGRSGFRSGQDMLVSPPSVAAGQLLRLPGGKWELRIPFSLTLPVDGLELYDPLGIDHTAVLTGTVVAVPEPGAGSATAAVSLALLAIAGLVRGGRGRRRGAALGAALLCALGCSPEFDPTLNKTSFVAPFRCVNEWLRVYEIVNNNPVLIGGGEIQNPTCNPNGITLNGTVSGGVGFQGINNAIYEYGERASRLNLGVTWNLDANSAIPLKIDYRVRFELDYPAGTTDRLNPPQLFYTAWDYGLGLTTGSSQSGTTTVNGATNPADWALRTTVLNGAGGTASFELALEAFRSGQGKEYQGVAVSVGMHPNHAKTNLDCRRLLGEELQFRVRTDLSGTYCSPGTAGSLCTNSSQCRSGLQCYDGTCRLTPFGIRWAF
jgi:hypothetical protein